MRILLSTSALGGVGGKERNVMSTIRALADHHVDVCATQVKRNGYFVEPSGRIIPDVLWKSTSNRVKAWGRIQPAVAAATHRFSKPYDIYIQYAGGQDVTRSFECHRRYLIPSGFDVSDIDARFDRVLMQSPDNTSFLSDPERGEVVLPPVYPVADSTTAVPGLPERYLLTVFNPHNPEVKGTDALFAAAASAALPIVWCYDSRNSARYERTHAPHPNVIECDGLTVEQLAHVYGNAAGYVSFSRSEGFGWAIADAWMHGLPIISRCVGVLALRPAPIAGVTFYDDQHGLDHALAQPRLEPSRPDDLAALVDPAAFEARLMQMAATAELVR